MALLMLPHATRNGIALIDALFTVTSAVCVTGLAVLDGKKKPISWGKPLFQKIRLGW